MRARSGWSLGDKDVDALGVLGRQVVGPAVASPHERKAVPVQTVGRSAVLDVRAPPVADRDAVLVVADAVLVLPVELVDLDLVAVPDRAGVEGFEMPLEHLLHAGDHRLGSEVRRASRGPGDPQRHLPPSCPRREWEQIRQVVVVVHVQVGDEDVVNLRHRDAHGEDVLDAAGAEVEEEAVAVAQFDHDAGAGLIAPRRKRATADERDPHLVCARLSHCRGSSSFRLRTDGVGL